MNTNELNVRNELTYKLDEFAKMLNEGRKNQYITKLKKNFVDYIVEEYPNNDVMDTLENNFNKTNVINVVSNYVINNKRVK